MNVDLTLFGFWAKTGWQAFLAQVGAGTIDQAILSILPARHQSLRLWGLVDKVLVIDEAHAYDAYMTKKIERLLKFHGTFGGSAIVLSATLPQEKRATLANAFLEGVKQGERSTWRPSISAYPLVTSVAPEKIDERPLALRDNFAREVTVQRIASLDEAYHRGVEAANRGAAVAIIRNTVDEAIASYEALSQLFNKVMLFHARFAMGDRQEIETDVLNNFGKEGRSDRNTILVATQVVEQSLDLDFDLIISDLAPVDLLIQRAGRLWRHGRGARAVAGPTFLVLSPEPLEEAKEHWPAPTLPKTNFVYKDAALLWRSAKAIFTAGKIVSRTSLECASVESGEVRALIEAVYGDDPLAIPPSLERSAINAMGRASADRTIAGHKLLELETGYDWAGCKWERETKIETRLGEETITLRLACIDAGQVVPWISDEGDPRRAWALSEVSLRRSRCSAADNPPELRKLIDEAQRGWTLSEKEMPVLVLNSIDHERWQGRVRGKVAISVSVFYSKSTGLQFASEGPPGHGAGGAN
jgi:CRISPR-associated endonuclease/helicase Cas3